VLSVKMPAKNFVANRCECPAASDRDVNLRCGL
jgi:hypothetical protein